METEKELAFKKSLANKKIAPLVLDQKWHRLFAIHGKTDEIKEMLSGTGIKLNDEEIRHLRNSLCHGRYFHDFNQTFYFYDGRKNLSLGAKLTIKDINKLLDKIALGPHAVVVLS